MNKSDIVERIAEKNKIKNVRENRKYYEQVKKGVDIFFTSIKDGLMNRDRVELRGLGTFSLKNYRSYTGRNPKTGGLITVKPKTAPFFKPSRILTKQINKVRGLAKD